MNAAARIEDLPLPELRAELQLLPGSPDAAGRPAWLIHDPLANTFTHIEAPAYEALRHWNDASTVGALVARIGREGNLDIDAQAIVNLVDFLYASQLTVTARAGGWQSFVRSQAARRHSLPAWLVHNYLFFRIPLVRPQRFLEHTYPAVRPLWSRPARVLIAVVALLGLYLASRQWQLFLGTLQSYFNWEGALVGALALALIKTAHELGHAYTAVGHGCRVHSMGIAFVVMAPMPYTDVTDAWRLTERRKRLAIDSAGMATEAAIAAFALLAWSFLADGPLRGAAFVLAAVSLASSLAINLNPFMRFDGYYLLSEMLGVENLQSRAFAVGRWRLREILFGLGAPCPEEMPAPRIAALIVYAWCVWIYRVFLFVGIALVVYHYFFKLLGLALFAVEIVYFVARPIASELLTWWKMRKLIVASPRSIATLLLSAAAIAATLVPWSTRIDIPAVLETARLQQLYPVRNARIEAVHVRFGDSVAAGMPIMSLASSDINDELARTTVSLRIAELQYGRRLADAQDREGSLVLESTIDALRARIKGLENERDELKVLAPFDGIIADLNPELHAGRWISPRDQIAIIASGKSVVAKGYAPEADIGRLSRGARATFIPEHPGRHSVALQIERIASAGATQIEIADLASVNSGPISVAPDDKRRLVPSTAQYLVTFTGTEEPKENELSVRGLVVAEGKPASTMARAWRRAIGILLRESGA